MSFNYQKHKDQQNHDSQWTSYSDLFMGLSFVFLLLYVTASLRTGTNGIQQQLQIRKVSLENEDLKNQLKVYNSLNKEYLETNATQDEAKQYEDLMAKLDLLQDQAKNEKEKLQTESQENAKKEVALNKYQQMIRNILNSNTIAKSRIKKRNTIIEEQDQEITDQDSKIGSLESTVEEKKQQIAQRESQIENMNQTLSKKLKELNWSYKNQKLTQKKYQTQMSQARAEHDKRLKDLQTQQAQAEQQLKAVNTQLASTQGSLGQAEAEKQRLANEKQQLAGKLAGAEKGFAEQAGKLKAEFQGQMARERAAFDAEVGRQKLSAADRAAKEAAYRAGIAKKERELGDKISGLKGQLAGSEAELAKARALNDAKKNVAKEIMQGFAKAGIKAEVDGETGDVTLDFGDHYFDSGNAKIKPEMAKILQKALPIYAKSLMENKKISGKISAIEIIGFASPTYQGRFIDPTSMGADDKKAVEYNLDLSYQRAKSIFQYVFNQDKMDFNHQKEIRPLVKVSGKSFFEAAKISRDVASANAKDFCKKFDCKKSQRVLIKFNVDQK